MPFRLLKFNHIVYWKLFECSLIAYNRRCNVGPFHSTLPGHIPHHIYMMLSVEECSSDISSVVYNRGILCLDYTHISPWLDFDASTHWDTAVILDQALATDPTHIQFSNLPLNMLGQRCNRWWQNFNYSCFLCEFCFRGLHLQMCKDLFGNKLAQLHGPYLVRSVCFVSQRELLGYFIFIFYHVSPSVFPLFIQRRMFGHI